MKINCKKLNEYNNSLVLNLNFTVNFHNYPVQMWNYGVNSFRKFYINVFN